MNAQVCWVRWIPLALIVSLALVPPAQAKDAIAEYLRSLGFSNVPYGDQVRIAPGGYVAYDANSPQSPALFYGPVEGETVTLIKDPKTVVVPGRVVDKSHGLDLEKHLFGIPLSAKFTFTDTIRYGDLTLEPSGVTDPNSLYSLLAPGQPLDKEAREYGDGKGVSVYTNQHLYLIETVYYARGIDITSTKGFSVAAGSAQVPDCTLPQETPSSATNDDKAKTQTPVTERQSVSNTTKTTPEASNSDRALSNIGDAALKAGLVAAGQATADQVGTKAKGSGGVSAAKAAGSTAAQAALKTASGSLPIEGGYCFKDRTTIHFTTATPVPIAAQLLALLPSSGTSAWNLVGAIVTTEDGKTKERPKKFNRSDFPGSNRHQGPQPVQQKRRKGQPSQQQQQQQH